MFSKLYITIKAKKTLDDSIIDPITFILMDWGVDGQMIDWNIYPDRAKLEISTDSANYQSYDITYQGLNTIMELCYEDDLILTIIDNDGDNEVYSTYVSEANSTNFVSDISQLE